LGERDGVARLFAKAGAGEALIELCDGGDGNATAFACGTLANLSSSPRGLQLCCRIGALQACFPLIRSPHPNTCAEATRAVWALLQDPDQAEQADAMGCGEALVATLHASSERAVHFALSALREMPPSALAALLMRESVSQLLSLLGSPTQEIISGSLLLLADAACGEATAGLVVEEGGLEALVGILEGAGEWDATQGAVHAGELATGVLHNLSSLNHSCSHAAWVKNAMIDAGIVPGLVQTLLVTRHTTTACANAARILASLSSTESYRHAIMQGEGGLTAFTELLRSSDPPVAAAARAVLDNLTPENMQDVNAVARMLAIRDHYLFGKPADHVDLELLGVPLIRETEAEAALEAAEAGEQGDATAIATLVASLRNPSDAVVDRACMALWGLAQAEGNRDSIRDAGAMAELSRILVSYKGGGELHKRVRENAITCMWQLSNFGP
jgi:hypothetical protein